MALVLAPLLLGCTDASSREEVQALRTEIAALRSDLSGHALRAEIAALRSDLSGHATGRESAQETLQRLIETGRARARWPADAAAAQELRTELAQVLAALSSEEEAALLPDLRTARWTVQALWVVRSFQDATGDAAYVGHEAAKELLAEHVLQAPADVCAALVDLEKSLAMAVIGQAIQEARTQPPVAALETVATLLEFDPGNKELEELAGKLRPAAARARAIEAAAEIARRLQSHKGGESHLVQAGLLQAHEELLRVRLGLLEEGVTAPVPEVDGVLGAIRASLEKEGSAAREHDRGQVRKYQRWALKQIALAEATFGEKLVADVKATLDGFGTATEPCVWPLVSESPSARAVVQSWTATPIADTGLTAAQQHEIYAALHHLGGWRGRDRDVAAAATRDGLLRLLAPIDLYLLDPPVAALYQRAYQTCWQFLDARPEQTRVAEEWSFVQKMAVGDVSD